MLLVFIVLTIVLVSSIVATQVRFKNDYMAALARELAIEPKLGDLHTFPSKRLEGNRIYRPQKISFSVQRNEKGDWTLLTPWMQVEQSTLETISNRAYEKEENSGFFSDFGVAYQKGDNRIAFVNLQSEQSQRQDILIIQGGVYIGALLLFLLISFGLSQWALKPVEQSWAQQKQFVSDASHELKTPLTVILANMDILEQENGENNWLSASRSEAMHMKKLIENMLFLTRSDEGRQSLQMEAIKLSSIVGEAALAFEAVAYEKEVTLKQNINQGLTIQGDRALIKQLVSILLDNAIKYTPKGGKIDFNLKKERDRAVISVCNSPSYIPPEQISHIFDRFYRTDDARTKTQGGYGLGLAIASEIALQHGATIKAHSIKGEGTTFLVKFLIK